MTQQNRPTRLGAIFVARLEYQGCFYALQNKRSILQKQRQTKKNKFKQTLLLYGSKRTYKAFEKYWKSITGGTEDSKVQMDLMEKVVSEMRRDAGAGAIKNNLSNIVINNSKIT